MRILQRIPLGKWYSNEHSGTFAIVNSYGTWSRVTRAENVHPWEGYLCVSAWLMGYLKTLKPLEGNSPPYVHS